MGNGIIRPLIPIKVINPDTKQFISILALLDTGADSCCFSRNIAEVIGHNFKHIDVITSVNEGLNEKAV